MNYILTPSLEHIALVKIATTLWNQDDIRTLMAGRYFPLLSPRRNYWQEIEDKVMEKVPQLPQPEPLKKEILGFIKPIGLQILTWIEYHDENCYLGVDRRIEFYWTPQGTVDKKKTVEALIKDENLDITKRYKLACIYCLEGNARELWGSMPQRKKSAFYNGGHPSFSQEHWLAVFWTYDIKGELAKLNGLIKTNDRNAISPYQFAFEHAADDGNKAATEYFLQKLTPREREESLVTYAGYVAYRRYSRCEFDPNRTNLPKENYADVLCFLLSQMDEEQKTEVFKNYPQEVLECLLDWPWQCLFMETANSMWDFISVEFGYLLGLVIKKVMDGYKDFNYQKLFGEFWEQSPNTCKECVPGRHASGFLSDLFEIEDEENVRLILKNATVSEKEEIIFTYKGNNICESLIYRNKWESLKFFVQECVSSKKRMIVFKEEFKKSIISRRSEETLEKEKDMWNKCFQLLDDLIHKDEMSSPVKRLHSTEFEEVTRSWKSAKCES